MSAQDYTVDATAIGCCRGAHVWDSPDGFVPQDGRQVACRVCPATAQAKPETPARAGRTPEQEKTCEASGRFTSSDPLVALLYTLMRNHLPTGVVAELVRDATATAGKSCEYTNGWLAQYAAHLSAALRTPAVPAETPVAREPECSCGHSEDAHVRSDWSPTRPCDECRCRDYAAARGSECNCGNPECGGCYPSAHGGTES